MSIPGKGTRLQRMAAPWPELPKLPAAAVATPDGREYERSLGVMWRDFREQLDRLQQTADRSPFFPGMILAWSRPLAEIPDGWQLADGTNGTVDLRDSFIKGVGAGEEPGASGGAARHTPAGTVAAPTFSGTAGTTDAATAGTPSGIFVGTADLETSEDSAGTPAGTNSAPALTMNSYTPGGTVSQPTFTGNAVAAASTNVTPDLVAADTSGAGVSPVVTATGTVSQPTFTGNAATLTGTVAAPVFTGTALADHSHTYTPEGTIEGEEMELHAHTFRPAGTNSAPAFTGTEASFEPRYYKLAFIQKL